MPYVDRFRRLEIPEDKRRADWGFLDAPLRLPAPLPLADRPLLLLVNGRALIPEERQPAAGEPSLIFHRDAHALVEIASPGDQEAAWRARHQGELAREAHRFVGTVPTAILRDAARLAEAQEILRLGLPEPSRVPDAERALPGALDARADRSLLTGRLVGHARLLRLHDKLYDLVTLREYLAIFERALAPDCFRFLQSLPLTVSPGEMLARIEERLDAIHAKARSPLRNKMSTCRATVNGVTLLPIYREEAAALFDAQARLLDRQLKLEALGDAA